MEKQMDWLNQISGMLQQYQGGNTAQTPQTVNEDFDQLTQAAPQPAVADGLAEAFRSDQTPPFGQMLGQLFNQSNGHQRASILNTLISTLGPTVMAQILSRTGGSGLAGILSGGQREVTPEQAAEIPVEAVQQAANEAETKDPSVIDMISNVYAQHPDLIKTLGGAALTIALAKIASRQYGG
jgi:hypothetical protein